VREETISLFPLLSSPVLLLSPQFFEVFEPLVVTPSSRAFSLPILFFSSSPASLSSIHDSLSRRFVSTGLLNSSAFSLWSSASFSGLSSRKISLSADCSRSVVCLSFCRIDNARTSGTNVPSSSRASSRPQTPSLSTIPQPLPLSSISHSAPGSHYGSRNQTLYSSRPGSSAGFNHQGPSNGFGSSGGGGQGRGGGYAGGGFSRGGGRGGGAAGGSWR